MTSRQASYQRTLLKYIFGFVGSLILTMMAYTLVVGRVFEGTGLLVILGGLALLQMIIQLAFFLHVGEEALPRFRMLSFAFMTLILIIVVAGSLWIMHHLNYNMMDMAPQAKDSYMMGQKDKGF